MTYRTGWLRFCLTYLAVSIGLPLLNLAVVYLTGLDFQSSAFAFIPMIVAATLEGQRFYKSEHRRPTGKEAWRVAIRLAGAATALSVVLALVFFVSDPASAAVFGPVGFVVLFSVMFLLLWVFGRIFLSLGAWTGANSAAKRAERDET